MLRPYLCSYGDMYFAVKGAITVEGKNDVNSRNKNLIIKNNTPFR